MSPGKQYENVLYYEKYFCETKKEYLIIYFSFT